MRLLSLPRSKVELGLPLPWNVRDANGNLLLTCGHVVESEHQLDLILERGAFVDVEEIKAAAEKTEKPKAVVLAPNIFEVWNKTTEDLKNLLSGLDAPGFSERVNLFASHIVKLIDANTDIALYRCVRQEKAQHFWYGYTHSVHTAILCVLLARHVKWPEARIMSLVKAAVTMNLSILDLQGQMAAQDVPMKDKQREEIHKHPALAVTALQNAGVEDEDWLNAIAQHHERPDGTGYPQASKDVGELAVALRVADVFMAKISPRVLRAALSPQDAVRQLYSEDKGGPISTAVIKEFGIFPPGDFVKLANGQRAVVVQRTDNAKAPIVAAITDAAGVAVAKTVRLDTSQKEYAIVGAATEKNLLARLPPERFYGYTDATALLAASSFSAPDPS